MANQHTIDTLQHRVLSFLRKHYVPYHLKPPEESTDLMTSIVRWFQKTPAIADLARLDNLMDRIEQETKYMEPSESQSEELYDMFTIFVKKNGLPILVLTTVRKRKKSIRATT
jgi:hypothetical protein